MELETYPAGVTIGLEIEAAEYADGSFHWGYAVFFGSLDVDV